MTGWRFALPPSLGREPIRTLARELADLLYDVGFTTVIPHVTYGRLEQALLAGEVDAAWGPPMVCARVEAAGGTVAMRAIRWGATSYRSVLLCRADDRLDLATLGKTRRRPRAVWVDAESMAGYVLPRAHLRSLGIDPARAFGGERVLGSYEACLGEVLDGIADLTATFASAEGAPRAASGHVDLCGFRAAELRGLAYTAASPNDGLVLAPRSGGGAAGAAGPEGAPAPPVPSAIGELRDALRRLTDNVATRRLVSQAFDVDGFDEPPPGTYQDLLALLAEKPPRPAP